MFLLLVPRLWRERHNSKLPQARNWGARDSALRLNAGLWLSIVLVNLRLNITYNTTTQYRTVCPPPHLLSFPAR